MGELEKALSAYRSRNTGLSEDDISEIKNLLVQESKDRKAQRRLMAEQKERDTIEYETRYNIDETGRGPIYFEGM